MDANKKPGTLEPLEILLEREKHAPLLTTDDLHAMPDDALRDIIRLCASQSRIYRNEPVDLPWYHLGAQAFAELYDRAFTDKMIFEHDRDLKAEVEKRAHEDELDDSAEIEAELDARALDSAQLDMWTTTATERTVP